MPNKSLFHVLHEIIEQENVNLNDRTNQPLIEWHEDRKSIIIRDINELWQNRFPKVKLESLKRRLREAGFVDKNNHKKKNDILSDSKNETTSGEITHEQFKKDGDPEMWHKIPRKWAKKLKNSFVANILAIAEKNKDDPNPDFFKIKKSIDKEKDDGNKTTDAVVRSTEFKISVPEKIKVYQSLGLDDKKYSVVWRKISSF